MFKTLRAFLIALCFASVSSPAFAYGQDNFGSGAMYVTRGGVYIGTIAAGAAGPVVLRTGVGRVAQTLITIAGSTGNVTLYDSATACSGTVLAVVPGATNAAVLGQVGTVSETQFRFINGLVACGGTGSPAVTIGWW